MSFQTITTNVEPEVRDPRNPFLEAIDNIAKVLEDNVLDMDEEANPEFMSPFVKRVYRGALHRAPDVWPAIDIRFLRLEAATSKALGTGTTEKGVSVLFPSKFAVRYFHSKVGQNIDHDDLEITANLYRIFDLLEFRNDLNGFCPRERAEVLGVSQDASVFLEFASAGFVLGGSIILDVPMRMNRTYFNGGFSARSTTLPSGP